MGTDKKNTGAKPKGRAQEPESLDVPLRLIIEDNADGIIIVDRKGVVRFANPAAEALFGREAGQLTGKSFGFPVVTGESSEVTVIRLGGEKATVEMRAAEMRVGHAEWGGAPVFIASLRDVTERKKMEDALRERTHELDERIKELDCLYGISQLVEKPGVSLEEIVQGTADLIPPGWQYPEITCARVTIDGEEYKTAKFRESSWRQASDIVVNGEKRGILEVYYLEEKPEIDEGPFLKEERNLINAITERLGRIIERKQAEQELKSSNQQLRASEQQLRASNQQLRASEQQLMASNQQLRASEQQLRASNQQLRANEERLRAEMAERRKIEEETKKHLHELEVFYKASIGREERIVELKKRVRQLEAELGKETG